jgi:hypothetical protein
MHDPVIPAHQADIVEDRVPPVAAMGEAEAVAAEDAEAEGGGNFILSKSRSQILIILWPRI